MKMVGELSATVRRAIIGLRERHPQADEEEIHRRLADLLLGKELAAELFGPLPDDREPTGGQIECPEASAQYTFEFTLRYEDTRSLLNQMDRDLVRRVAAELGVQELLEQAEAEIS